MSKREKAFCRKYLSVKGSKLLKQTSFLSIGRNVARKIAVITINVTCARCITACIEFRYLKAPVVLETIQVNDAAQQLNHCANVNVLLIVIAMEIFEETDGIELRIRNFNITLSISLVSNVNEWDQFSLHENISFLA